MVEHRLIQNLKITTKQKEVPQEVLELNVWNIHNLNSRRWETDTKSCKLIRCYVATSLDTVCDY